MSIGSFRYFFSIYADSLTKLLGNKSGDNFKEVSMKSTEGGRQFVAVHRPSAFPASHSQHARSKQTGRNEFIIKVSGDVRAVFPICEHQYCMRNNSIRWVTLEVDSRRFVCSVKPKSVDKNLCKDASSFLNVLTSAA